MNRILLLLTCFLLLPAGSAEAAAWVRVGGGFSQMAMDDINGASFDFYDDPSSTATFADVGTGFILDVALGHDLSPSWGLGIHWDRQWASTSATDQGVDGKLNLGANLFIARGYWRPVRHPGWNLGLVAGIGPIFSRGDVKVDKGSTNYGESDIKGNGWSLDGAVLVGVRLGESSELQIQGGYRSAEIDKLEVEDRELKKDDGSSVAADYSGFQVKVGVRWLFGED